MLLERGRVGTGSVLALDAIGPQDTFLLNENMADSSWDPTYTQTTNFAITQRILPLPGNKWIGDEVTFEIVPKEYGDMLSNLHLKCSLPALPPGNVYTDQIGRAVLSQVDFMIDGQVIESLNDDWYIVRDQLFLDADEKNAMAYAINGGYSEGTLSTQASTPRIDMIIPLDFFFCRRHSRYKKHRERLDKPYFPMCSIYNQKVYIKMKFNKWAWFSNSIADTFMGNVTVSSVPIVSNGEITLNVNPIKNFVPSMYITGLPFVSSKIMIKSADPVSNTVVAYYSNTLSNVTYPLSVGFKPVKHQLTIPTSRIFYSDSFTFTLDSTDGVYVGMAVGGFNDFSRHIFINGNVQVTEVDGLTVTLSYSSQEPRMSSNGYMSIEFTDPVRQFTQIFAGPVPPGSTYTFTTDASFRSPVLPGMVVTGLPDITGEAVVTNVNGPEVTVSFTEQTPPPWSFPVSIANQTDFLEPPKMIIEEIQLTDEERQFMKTQKKRLIVNRAVKEPPLFFDQGTNGQIILNIGASFPVTFMSWFIRKTDFETATRHVDSRYAYGYTTKYINAATPVTFFNGVKLNYIDLITSGQISLNGNEILSKFAGGLYFTMKQPYDHALSIPTKSVYVYAFGLNPKEYNQGGFIDFSPLNSSTTTLSIEFNPEYAAELAKSFSMYVFYYGYTLIEIENGFARLVFT
jgi:hypothetical protein